MISESSFQAALESAVNSPERPTRVQRINCGDTVIASRGGGRRRIRGAKKGTADLVGFAAPDGRYVEIEAKSADGKLSGVQDARGEWIRKSGGVHVTVWADRYDLEKSVRDALFAIDLEIQEARNRRTWP